MNARDHTTEVLRTFTTATAQRVNVSHDGKPIATGKRIESLAEEVPVALVYNGISHAVMLATPQDLGDFALGFSLTEGILSSPADLYDCEVTEHAAGIELNLQISSACMSNLKLRRRNLAGRTGCGMCGIESLEAATRTPHPVADGLQVTAKAIQHALAEMTLHQPMHDQTHAIHGAAWANCDGEILLAREDVGRHNALDKLLGALGRTRITPTQGFVVLTSRASVEMIHKVLARGIQLVAFISAPTSMALNVAQDTNLTLIANARNTDFLIYTGAQRIQPFQSHAS